MLQSEGEGFESVTKKVDEFEVGKINDWKDFRGERLRKLRV